MTTQELYSLVSEVSKMSSASREARFIALMRLGKFDASRADSSRLTRAVRWRLSEIQEWLESRPRASGQKARIA